MDKRFDTIYLCDRVHQIGPDGDSCRTGIVVEMEKNTVTVYWDRSDGVVSEHPVDDFEFQKKTPYEAESDSGGDRWLELKAGSMEIGLWQRVGVDEVV